MRGSALNARPGPVSGAPPTRRGARRSTLSHMRTIRVVDSHTGGEPTRVVIEGGPDLGTGSLAERRERFRRDHDRFRTAVVGEPRGSEAMVGALLCAPDHPDSAAGVIYFDNGSFLGMCGHGTIG